MKTRIVCLTRITFIAGILLTGCGEKSKQDAIEVKEDVIELNKDLIRGAINTAEEIKIAVKKEWDKFITVSEIAIENTEKEIMKLREKISKTNTKERKKLTKKLNELEQRNIILKDKLFVQSKKLKEDRFEFNEEAKERQKEFERKFNQDMEALETALQNLFNDNMN